MNNALITYEVSGIGWTKTKQVRGRVTPKRVITLSATWDRETKQKIGKHGMYHYKLISVSVD